MLLATHYDTHYYCRAACHFIVEGHIVNGNNTTQSHTRRAAYYIRHYCHYIAIIIRCRHATIIRFTVGCCHQCLLLGLYGWHTLTLPLIHHAVTAAITAIGRPRLALPLGHFVNMSLARPLSLLLAVMAYAIIFLPLRPLLICHCHFHFLWLRWLKPLRYCHWRVVTYCWLPQPLALQVVIMAVVIFIMVELPVGWPLHCYCCLPLVNGVITRLLVVINTLPHCR